MGVTDLAPISEPVTDAAFCAVVGSARTRVLDAGSDSDYRSSDVCFVGGTRKSFSEKMMTASCIYCTTSFKIMNCFFFN